MDTSEKAQRSFAYRKFLEDRGAEDNFRAKKWFLENLKRDRLSASGRAHFRKGIEELYQIMGTHYINGIFNEVMEEFREGKINKLETQAFILNEKRKG